MRHITPLVSGLLLLACSSSSTAERVESSESELTSDGGADAAPTTSPAQALVEVTDFGANPASLKMFEYVPAKLGTAAPALVLVMHGCNQGAADVAKTGWNDVADQLGSFVVVYPEQVTANNQMKCFNWAGVYGDLTKIQRGKEENQSIKNMVDKAIALHKVDAKRVFVVGFSAGGGEAAIMAATWPEVFAAGATIAGIPYHCNTTFSEAFSCQKPGKDKTPAEWSTLVKEASPPGTTIWPRMSIWQGASDSIVSPTNRNEMLEQWTEVHGVGQTPSATDTVDGAAHTVYKDKNGKILVESYEVPGMDHGVSVAPTKACGTTAQNSFGLDKGICTASHVAAFFGLTSAASATTNPDGGVKPVTSSSSSTSSSSGGGGDGGMTNGSSSSTGGVAPPKSDEPGEIGSTCSFSGSSYSSSKKEGSPFQAIALLMFALGAAAVLRIKRIKRVAR